MSDLARYSEIISKLEDTHKRGLESGDVCFYSSTVSAHVENGVEFEIRLCPSLSQKKPPPVDEGAKKEDFNPFLPPYRPGLYIGDIEEDGEHYTALLNKYCVVEHHFLLVTKEFRLQTSPLTPEDLSAAYKVLVAAKKQGRPFFMFYNCGIASGSSQKHKHMQFLPIDGSSPQHAADGPPVERLARKQKLEADWKPFYISALQYAHNVIRLPSSSDSEEMADILAQSYIKLLDLTMKTFTLQPISPQERGEKPAYNVLLTLEHMHMIPRAKAEYESLPDGQGHLPVNALGFAGMLMVKCEAEREALIKAGLMNVLKGVALPDIQGESCSKVESSLMDEEQ